jgi:GGDEF domain-containing protein
MNLFSSFDLVLCILSAYVGFNHLILFINKKSYIENLHFSLLCFAIALNDIACIGLYNSTSIINGEFWQKGQFFCATLISIEFVNFTFCLINKKSNLIKKILLFFIALSFFLGIFFNQFILDQQQPMIRLLSIFGVSITYYEHNPGIIWNLLFINQILGMGYLYFLLIINFIKNKKRDLFPLLIGFLIFFISAVIDILIAINKITFLYTVEYSFLTMLLVMDYILIKRFIKVFDEVESLNQNLGEKVIERTLEIQKMADEISKVNKELHEKNITLLELSERDSMTKLLNHATFLKRLSELFNLSDRYKFPICVMVLDVDYFKKINDTYGHQTGDKVIIKVSETLNSNSREYDFKAHFSHDLPELRNYDIAGRYGGDEFAIALPYCGENESKIVGDRICNKIRNLEFESNTELHITSSIGCAVLLDHSACIDELYLIKIADKALYQAKQKGRDTVDLIVI